MMNRLKAAALAAAIWMLPAIALAQTSPNWPFGYVPTVQEFAAAFAGKMDYLGSPAITAAGGTLTGKLTFANSSSGSAGMNCGVGTAPSSPVNGDVWCTTAGMFVYAGGVTIGPFGAGAGGTLAVNAGGTGVTTITSGNVLVGQGTSPITSYPTSGTNTRIASTTITSAGSGHCVSINGAGDLVDAGVGACGGTGGSGSVNSSTIGQVAVYTGATAVTGIAACNNGYYGTNGAGTVSCITTVNTTLSATITALGTIASGTWQGGIIAGQYGGTGVANTGNTITLNGNNLAITGGAITLTAIGATNVTMPTTGSLMNQNGTSGGIPYYNTTTSTQSSAALTANLPVLGGGAGAAPISGTRQGNTTAYLTYSGSSPGAANNCAVFDGSGATANIKDSGVACGTSAAAPVLLTTLTASASASLTDINSSCPTADATHGCFSSSYLNYRIDFQNLVATTPSTTLGCMIHVYNVGGTYQTAGYKGAFTGLANGTFANNTVTTYIPCAPVNNSSTGANTLGAPGVTGSVFIANPNPASSPGKAMWVGQFGWNTSGATFASVMQMSGWWDTSGGVTGFRVCFGTSAPTCASTIASGSVKVYGLP